MIRIHAAILTAVAGLASTMVGGCGDGGSRTADPPLNVSSIPASALPRPTTTPTTTPTPTPTATPDPTPGSTPPPWLGERVLPRAANGYGVIRPTPPELRHRAWTLPDTVPALPGDSWAGRVVSPAPADVIARSTWAPGCPVSAAELAWVRVAFVGFDGRRHTGELLVNTTVADDVVTVFHLLYDARWPIEQMTITSRAEFEREEAAPTGDGNNTESFVCRPVTGSSAATYSQHAYGLAIDVDPFQNPYVKGDLVVPERASWYLDRSRAAPGVITPDGPVVAAFKAIGWGWGGEWHSLKDYQHFSSTGR